jgi:hypothetical protein
MPWSATKSTLEIQGLSTPIQSGEPLILKAKVAKINDTVTVGLNTFFERWERT